MKKLFSLIPGLVLGIALSAQAPLPTSYDFTGFAGQATLPNGWTTNCTGTFTYAVGQVGVAGKIDQEAEFVQIQTADPMGTVTYYLKGWIGGGPTSWTGTFKVQESVDGTAWTDLASYTTLNIGSYDQYNVSPDGASRYVRFYFENKETGCNVGVDEVSVTLGELIGSEINLTQGAETIFSNGSASPVASPVGIPVNFDLTVENLGSTEDLQVTDISFSGPAAVDYAATAPAVPFTVGTQSAQAVTITFAPSAVGTREAVMTITNTDSNEGAYVINLSAVGGDFATEPVNQATGLTFTNVKSFRITGELAAAGDVDGYLVLRKTGSAVTDIPVDGLSYGKGDPIGASKVFYNGPASAFTINEVQENANYHFAVFAFNGSGSVTNYLQAAPLTANVTSAANNPGTLYAGINTSVSSFVNDLHAVVNPHTAIFYGNYDETMVRHFEGRDTLDGQRVITCVYSGEEFVYTEPFNWDYFSREHTFCHAWMPTNPADNPEKPEYNDQHHLFPTQFPDANQVRLDWPLGEVVTVVSTYLDSKFGLNAAGKTVFEPRDAQKGDAVRAIMYMTVAYNTVSGNNWHVPNTGNKIQDQNILRKWHYQDPPSGYEKARNEFLDSLQGNRNPFVDHPEYACFIDFWTMEYISGATAPCASTNVGIAEVTDAEMVLFPNPSNGTFSMVIKNGTPEMAVAVYDLSGKKVYGQQVSAGGTTVTTLNLENLASGAYIIRVNGDAMQFQSKLMVQH